METNNRAQSWDFQDDYQRELETQYTDCILSTVFSSGTRKQSNSSSLQGSAKLEPKTKNSNAGTKSSSWHFLFLSLKGDVMKSFLFSLFFCFFFSQIVTFL